MALSMWERSYGDVPLGTAIAVGAAWWLFLAALGVFRWQRVRLPPAGPPHLEAKTTYGSAMAFSRMPRLAWMSGVHEVINCRLTVPFRSMGGEVRLQTVTRGFQRYIRVRPSWRRSSIIPDGSATQCGRSISSGRGQGCMQLSCTSCPAKASSQPQAARDAVSASLPLRSRQRLVDTS